MLRYVGGTGRQLVADWLETCKCSLASSLTQGMFSPGALI